MAFFNGLSDVRKINWASTFYWDLKIEGTPYPFNDWFPASEVSIEEAHLNLHEIELYNTAIRIPHTTQPKTISITFHDDESLTLFKFFRKWVREEILNLDKNDSFTSRLERSAKTIIIQKYNSRKNEPVDQKAYLIIPESTTLSWIGNSSPEATQYQLSFVIVGEVV